MSGRTACFLPAAKPAPRRQATWLEPLPQRNERYLIYAVGDKTKGVGIFSNCSAGQMHHQPERLSFNRLLLGISPYAGHSPSPSALPLSASAL
ncbi:hypothetical protein NITLEN_80164 [Nitrospira lenta]|uniref:Uncharacterized protein n=1 Tax=Nitrospira lenta TaxID=1436998 RepID=A0A330L9S9_9BACT|nr:hypothetical protein NITLEN_80164 [Nitrospira lenta]